jgi:hypothetical protein
VIKPAGGGKYVVTTHDGARRLGPPKSHDAAVKQLRAIEIAKAKRAGKKF